MGVKGRGSASVPEVRKSVSASFWVKGEKRFVGNSPGRGEALRWEQPRPEGKRFSSPDLKRGSASVPKVKKSGSASFWAKEKSVLLGTALARGEALRPLRAITGEALRSKKKGGERFDLGKGKF